VPVQEEALLNGETLPEIPIDDGPVNLKDDLILLEDSFTPTPVVSTGIETNHVNSDVSADNQVTEQDTDWGEQPALEMEDQTTVSFTNYSQFTSYTFCYVLISMYLFIKLFYFISAHLKFCRLFLFLSSGKRERVQTFAFHSPEAGPRK